MCIRENESLKGGDVMPRPMSSDYVCFPREVMSCHDRRCRPCLQSKGGDFMPRPTSSDRVWSPREIMSCHARRHSSVFAAQQRWCYATPNVVRPSVLSKGGDGMSCSTSSDRVCSRREVMSCHARCRLTVCAAQRRWYHATTDVVRPSVLSRGGNDMSRPTSFERVCCPKAVMSSSPNVVLSCVLPKGDDGMPRPTSFDHVSCPKAVMACHAWRCSTIFAVQGLWLHATFNVIRPCVLPKRRWRNATPDVVLPCVLL